MCSTLVTFVSKSVCFTLTEHLFYSTCICSMDNLCKDIFLRSKMDDQGFIPISVIANFNRVSTLVATVGPKSSCITSNKLDM
jgi:hypothetical protein